MALSVEVKDMDVDATNLRTPFGKEMREKHFLFTRDYVNLNQGTVLPVCLPA
jgi:hypothetical protein